MLSHQTEDIQAVAGPPVHADHCASSASGVQGGYRPGLPSSLHDQAPAAPGHQVLAPEDPGQDDILSTAAIQAA